MTPGCPARTKNLCSQEESASIHAKTLDQGRSLLSQEVPELEVLSLQAAGSSLDFKPWVYDYAVELDMSFRVVELAVGLEPPIP